MSKRFAAVALDSNVLYDLADNVREVVQAVGLLREAECDGVIVRLIVTPTVIEELSHDAIAGVNRPDLAIKALRSLKLWGVVPHEIEPAYKGALEAHAKAILSKGFFPKGELNDALVFVEAAMAEAVVLTSSDKAMIHAPSDRLAEFLSKKCHLAAPRIISPKALRANHGLVFRA